MDPMYPEVKNDWLIVKPIGKAEFVIRQEQIYELNGPSQEGPCKVGIVHSYGKREEIIIPVYLENYFDLRQRLTQVAPSEQEKKLLEAMRAQMMAPPALPAPPAPVEIGPKPELKFEK
jgi:hypothetical protein